MKSFLTHFTEVVSASFGADYSDNCDELRFGKMPALPHLSLAPKALFFRWLKGKGCENVCHSRNIIESAMDFVSPHLSRLEHLYTCLVDEESRQWLAQLMAYRALGYRRVKLSLNTPSYWKGRQDYQRLASRTDTMDSAFRDLKLHRLDLQPINIPVSLYASPEGAHILFTLEQYRCSCSTGDIAVVPGDIVMDCGGCWGDTALYFANRAGTSGRVFTFEFLSANLRIMRKNLELNPDLAKRVEIVERAVSETSGCTMGYTDNGPGTCLTNPAAPQNTAKTTTISIDDLVTEKRLPRVDFIKMDIEGSELSSLRGSEQALRQFHPKLAISVYHRLEDFFEIPDYLESLNLNYRFYLRHFTIFSEETVLFATSEPASK